MKEIDSVVTMFRDQEYAAHWKFNQEQQDGCLEDWTIVGHAMSHIITGGGDKIPSEVLVWIENSVVSMTNERCDRQNN